MVVENKEDFVKWNVGTALKNIVCLSKPESIQKDLDSLDHVARLRANIKAVVATYEKENKAYLASQKPTPKTEPKKVDSTPDFSTMTSAQFKAWQKTHQKKA